MASGDSSSSPFDHSTAHDDDNVRFDAVRAVTTTASLVAQWNVATGTSSLSFSGCNARPIAQTLLRVLERALDDSCPHDLLLMVTGIYVRLGGVALDGVLELFFDGGGSSKTVISVLEQLASRAKVKWELLTKSGLGNSLSTGHGSEGAMNEHQRFGRAYVTILQFCMELKA
jgi:hypothetical protein